MLARKSKKTLEEKQRFIKNTLETHEPDSTRNSISDDQVQELYSELVEVDELFRNLAQIAILKKEIEKLKAEYK